MSIQELVSTQPFSLFYFIGISLCLTFAAILLWKFINVSAQRSSPASWQVNQPFLPRRQYNSPIMAQPFEKQQQYHSAAGIWNKLNNHQKQ